MAGGLAMLMAACLAACNAAGGLTSHATEVARARSGDVDVVLLADQPALNQGEGEFTLEFRSSSDSTKLVDAGPVKANATMPMAGMSPMFGTVAIEPTGTPGRYRGRSELAMAGQWRLNIQWNGPSGPGEASFAPAVQ